MLRRPPRSTRTDTLFPYTTLFRSAPELGLQHDGHLAGVARAQRVRNLAVEMIGAEGDVEMVAAGQAVLRDVDKRPAHHNAQGVFHHAIVSQTVAAHFLGHVAPRPDCGRLILPRILASSGIPRWGASVRSEERRVGKECVSTCRSRWAP